ncbi:hypothetical protein HGP28_03870 [Vibrio sp. SM6]|uniref:Uncharacterized protein n=1 Tax=Vibrio agarilyticus TaxID=2726741 RepID=A0A7X8TNY8_9VIBR|nr:hypothetical protein [Vibrio agarilyticus]NLS12029.1 hypothetical protein [Vibrio agarilyticus]
MNQNTLFLQALCVVTLLISAVLGHQIYQTSHELVLAQVEVSLLHEQMTLLEEQSEQHAQLSSADELALNKTIASHVSLIAQQKKQIAKLSSQLTRARADIETHKLQALAQKLEMEREQNQLRQQIAEQLATLTQENEQTLATQRLQLEDEFSDTAEQLEMQKRVDQIMTKFTALKVDLDVLNTCDRDYLDRYGEAKSMLNHMTTYIKQNKLSDDYYYFVIANDAQLVRQNRQLCIEN